MMYHGIEVCNNKERFFIMNKIFYEALVKVLDEDQIKPEEPMKNHVTFRVGGSADFFVTPKNYEELSWVLKCCAKYEMPCYIMGNGSNLLVSDQGYRGVVIQLFRQLNDIQCEGNVIRAQAGALLSAVANRALEEKLTGFEFAAGIPGTLGGACVMNAGAYGGEMKDVLKSVTVLTREGERITLQKNELELGYRTSIIAKKDYIVLEAEIELKAGDAEEIKAVMDDLKERRTTKQPLEYPSAGSTFKRPEGYFAGKLVDDAGLRGYRVGNVMVSEKHCGFVVNVGGGTCEEAKAVITHVREEVEKKFGVILEMEVRKLGWS